MRERLLAAVLTVAVFAAGFGAGLWVERHRPLPPPPGGYMSEYDRGARHGGDHPAPAPANRAQLLEQIAQIGPQMETFRTRIQDIYAQFDRDMDTVLTDQQKALYESRFRSQRTYGPPKDIAKTTGPLTDAQIEQLLQRPFRTLAFFVVIPMTLDRMTTELKLDDAQRARVKDYLRIRREKFIELVDGSPPLSLMLSRLAPIAQRISEPDKAP
jgi:hypothetical protein